MAPQIYFLCITSQAPASNGKNMAMVFTLVMCPASKLTILEVQNPTPIAPNTE